MVQKFYCIQCCDYWRITYYWIKVCKMWIRDAVKGTRCCMEVWVQPCWMVFISKNPLPHGSFQNIFHSPNRQNFILVNPFPSVKAWRNLLRHSSQIIFYLNSNFRVIIQINVKNNYWKFSPQEKNPHAPKHESVPFPWLQGRRGNPHLSPSSSSHSALPLLQHCPRSEAQTSLSLSLRRWATGEAN